MIGRASPCRKPDSSQPYQLFSFSGSQLLPPTARLFPPVPVSHSIVSFHSVLRMAAAPRLQSLRIHPSPTHRSSRQQHSFAHRPLSPQAHVAHHRAASTHADNGGMLRMIMFGKPGAGKVDDPSSQSQTPLCSPQLISAVLFIGYIDVQTRQ